MILRKARIHSILTRSLLPQVLRDFKTPEGVPEGQLDAAGDGEVLVVVDLRVDDGMVEAGIAREIVNRCALLGVGKMRRRDRYA
jgi:hypothetical protein